MKRAEVVELLEEVDKDHSGEVDYYEFLQIMTTTLGRTADAKEKHVNAKEDASDRLPFSLMATAYRRKRLMEGLVSRDKAVQQQLEKMSGKLGRSAEDFSTAAASEKPKADFSMSDRYLKEKDVYDAGETPSLQRVNADLDVVVKLIPRRIREAELRGTSLSLSGRCSREVCDDEVTRGIDSGIDERASSSSIR